MTETGGCIIFVDEIDALTQSRDEQTPHEASRRILSLLLRRVDGFESHRDKTTLICTTNRTQDLDAAFLSRVDVSVSFPLPDVAAREAIFYRYACQLTNDQIKALAKQSDGLSGRNIKDVCQDAERRWASEIIRGKNVSDVTPPPLKLYIESIQDKKAEQRCK